MLARNSYQGPGRRLHLHLFHYVRRSVGPIFKQIQFLYLLMDFKWLSSFSYRFFAASLTCCLVPLWECYDALASPSVKLVAFSRNRVRSEVFEFACRGAGNKQALLREYVPMVARFRLQYAPGVVEAVAASYVRATCTREDDSLSSAMNTVPYRYMSESSRRRWMIHVYR